MDFWATCSSTVKCRQINFAQRKCCLGPTLVETAAASNRELSELCSLAALCWYTVHLRTAAWLPDNSVWCRQPLSNPHRPVLKRVCVTMETFTRPGSSLLFKSPLADIKLKTQVYITGYFQSDSGHHCLYSETMIDVMIVAALTSTNPTVLTSKLVVLASVGTEAGSIECGQERSVQTLMKIGATLWSGAPSPPTTRCWKWTGQLSVFNWALWAIMKRSQSMVEQNEGECEREGESVPTDS